MKETKGYSGRKEKLEQRKGIENISRGACSADISSWFMVERR
jgi:hypothetical protein